MEADLDAIIERLQTADHTPLQTPGKRPIMAGEIPDMILALALEIRRIRDAKPE